MERNYWQLGRWRRIPVAMHWTVLLSFVWLYLLFWDLLATAIASAALVALLVAHEFGHVALLRRKKIAVFAIRLYGIHGETEHGYASRPQAILAAWGGVAAQLFVLVLALGLMYLTRGVASPLFSIVAGPVLFIFTKINVLLMVIALLPIGPFDGHDAWAAIPYLRGLARLRRKERQQHKRRMRERALFPEETLSPERLQELEESSARSAAEVMARLSKKTERREDNR